MGLKCSKVNALACRLPSAPLYGCAIPYGLNGTKITWVSYSISSSQQATWMTAGP
jgi:hypothetical protein